MTVKNPLELLVALLFFGGSLFMLYQTTNINSMEDVGLGARFFPRILFCTIAVLSLSMLKGTLSFGGKPATRPEKKEKDPNDATALQWGYIGVLFVYILCMRHIGYMVSTFLFCFIVMTLLAPSKTPRNLCVNAVLSAMTAGLLVYVFGTVLNLFLP